MAYIDTSNMPLHMPVPGSREPAQISLLNENCVVIDAHDHTTGKGLAMGRLRSGLQANRPAAGSAGNVYFATDTGAFYVDTGTAWVQFITSGGQATVSGWTLIDPIIRDTIQWGPEGSGTIDYTMTRTAAQAMQFSGSLGVGVAPIVGQNPTIQVQEGRFGTGYVTHNSYLGTDGKNHAISNNVASSLTLTGGNLYYYNAPAVAADAEQTFKARFSVDSYGTAGITADPAKMGLLISGDWTQAAFDNMVSLRLSRLTPSTSTQWISFQGGAASGDMLIGRKKADDTLFITLWNGVSLADRVAIQADGTIRLNSGASSGALIFNAGGSQEQRYMLSTAYQDDFTLQDVIRNGATVLRVVRTTNSLHLGPNAGQPALVWGAGNLHYSGSNPEVRATGAQNVQLFGAGGYVHPSGDNVNNLGAPSQRWQTVFAVAGAINTSTAEAKDDEGLIDPEVALAEVKRVPVHLFRYKAVERDYAAMRAESLKSVIGRRSVDASADDPPTPEEEAEAEAAVENAKAMDAQTDGYNRYLRVGFMAEDAADPAGGDALLLVGPDAVEPQNTAGVLMAAVQALAAKVEALEAKNAAAA